MNRKGLARWQLVYQIYLPAIDTIVTGMVAVTMGRSIMESITRARTHLAVILFENPVDADSAIVKEESLYIKTKKILQKAVHQGLVDHIE